MSYLLLTDHPGWTLQPNGSVGRLLITPTGTRYAKWSGKAVKFTALDLAATTSAIPQVESTEYAELPSDLPEQVTRSLSRSSTVLRLRNPDLWDAITSQLLRQTMRAPHPHAAYRNWAITHGRRYPTPDGLVFAIPRPEYVSDLLPSHGRPASGAETVLRYLAQAATAYRQHHTQWQGMGAHELANALRELAGFGARSAARAAADFTGDFSVYTPSDPALRVWAAGNLLPTSEREFTALWQTWTPTLRQRHALAVFVLALNNRAANSPSRPRGVAADSDPQWPALSKASRCGLPGAPSPLCRRAERDAPLHAGSTSRPRPHQGPELEIPC